METCIEKEYMCIYKVIGRYKFVHSVKDILK